MKRHSCTLLVLVLLAGCSKAPPPNDTGLAVHQSVVILGQGTPGERRLSVLEDERITPDLRRLMWGGPKDPRWLLAQTGIGDVAGLKASLAATGWRRGLLRLTDHAGTVIAERRLDCELGQIAEPALPQGDGVVFGVGDDCSTGEGDFAGLVTRFLVPSPDHIRFETYQDEATGKRLELTLVTANRIAWHASPRGTASLLHEVSSHPDFDDPRFLALKPGDPPPPDLPWVIEYLTYRWDGAADWIRAVRVEHGRQWDADAAFPGDAAFP